MIAIEGYGDTLILGACVAKKKYQFRDEDKDKEQTEVRFEGTGGFMSGTHTYVLDISYEKFIEFLASGETLLKCSWRKKQDRE